MGNKQAANMMDISVQQTLPDPPPTPPPETPPLPPPETPPPPPPETPSTPPPETPPTPPPETPPPPPPAEPNYLQNDCGISIVSHIETGGIMTALISENVMNTVLENNKMTYDMRNPFLTKGRFQRVFRQLDYDIKKSPLRLGRTITTGIRDWSFNVRKTCDIINNVTLMIQNPRNIEWVEIEYGGQRFDRCTWDQLQINAKIFKQKITQCGDNYMIPLCMSPFHSNLLAFPATSFHELHIHVVLRREYDGPMELYANTYYLETEPRRKLYAEPHEFVSYQSCINEGDIKRGVNTINIYAHRPCCLMYLYGFDKSKVKNIKLLLNKQVYYDGSIHALDHIKAQYGYDNIEETMFIFANPLNSNDVKYSNINFSRLDNVDVVIDTEEEHAVVFISSLLVSVVRHMNGMYGLAFSK